MLYIIGLGLKPSHLTLEALEALKACDRVYLEAYTSRYSAGRKEDLEDLIGKAVTEMGRGQVEQDFGVVLGEAGSKKVALCVFGNPLNATTHLQLLLDAKERRVKTSVMPGISVFGFAAFTGLERYKFGRTTSIVFHEQDYEPESFYDAIVENKGMGLHTLCLLDIKSEEGKMMNIGHAVSLLERIEEKREKSVLSESILVGLSSLGAETQMIKAGTAEQLKSAGFPGYPQSLIVCGRLNEKEMEGLRMLGDLDE